jgi:enoyl-CoA hydratase
VFENILVSRDGHATTIKLDRPRRRNALSLALVREMSTALDEIERDDDCRVLMFLGDDVAFCAGQDLKEPHSDAFIPELNVVFDRIESFAKPTIAVIGGWCIAGGLELAMVCDLRVGSEEAKLGDWHAKINSLGGGGAVARLPRLIGMARAKELILTGEAVDGRTAHAYGLLNFVHPASEYVGAARALAERVARIDPRTAQRAKAVMHKLAEMPLAEAVAESLVEQNRFLAEMAVDLQGDFQRRKG